MNISQHKSLEILGSELEGEASVKQLYFLKRNWIKTAIYIILMIGTVMMLEIVCYYYSNLKRVLQFDFTDSIHKADHILIKQKDDTLIIVAKNSDNSFHYYNLKYTYDTKKNNHYIKQYTVKDINQIQQLYFESNDGFYTEEQTEVLRKQYGKCQLDIPLVIF